MTKTDLYLYFRQLRKYKRFTVASFAGLTMGISAFLFLLLYLFEIRKYNHWDPAFDDIYELRYNRPFSKMGSGEPARLQTPKLSDYLARIPQIEAFTRSKPIVNVLISSKQKKAVESEILMVDSNFLQFFPFHLKYGNAASALDEDDAAVLTDTMAIKYFGRVNCIGDTFHIDNKRYKVTGILGNNGPMSFPVRLLYHLKVPQWAQEYGWGNYGYYYYVRPVASLHGQQALLDSLGLQLSRTWYALPEVFETQKTFLGLGKNYQEWNRDPGKIRMVLFPFRQLYTEKKETIIQVLTIIGVTILLLCCLDYTHKQIAMADTRNTEMGIRLISGERIGTLIGQLLSETALFVLLAFFTSFVIVETGLPYLNKLLEEHIQFYPALENPGFLLVLILSFGLIVLSAGGYPAYYLAHLPPVHILKGNYHGEDNGFRFRTLLLSLQLLLANTIAIVVMVVLLQAGYLRHLDTGYQPKNVYYTAVSRNLRLDSTKMERLDSLLTHDAAIVSHGYTDMLPLVDAEANFEELAYRNLRFNSLHLNITPGFFRTIGATDSLISTLSDEQHIIINEGLVRQMKLTPPFRGKKLTSIVPPEQGGNIVYSVDGYMHDILYQSWDQPSLPIFYSIGEKIYLPFAVYRTTEKSSDGFRFAME